MQQRKALGKGLASLIPTVSVSVPESQADSGAMMVPIASIVPNRQQPRTFFDDERLEELAASIRLHGVIQPLVVRSSMGDRYELIAGERRWRAARIAGLSEVPVIIKQIDDEVSLELAIIENIQREDLNAIEEAKGYQALVDQFDYTQDEAAEKVGKSRAAVANALRLLHLPKVIQDDVMQGRMHAGHARALLVITDLQEQLTLRERILHQQLTVRDVEVMVQERRGRSRSVSRGKQPVLTPQLRLIVDEMTKILGTKVILRPRGEKGGTCQIEYYSLQDLDRVYRRIVKS